MASPCQKHSSAGFLLRGRDNDRSTELALHIRGRYLNHSAALAPRGALYGARTGRLWRAWRSRGRPQGDPWRARKLSARDRFDRQRLARDVLSRSQAAKPQQPTASGRNADELPDKHRDIAASTRWRRW